MLNGEVLLMRNEVHTALGEGELTNILIVHKEEDVSKGVAQAYYFFHSDGINVGAILCTKLLKKPDVSIQKWQKTPKNTFFCIFFGQIFGQFKKKQYFCTPE